ncbi:MAG: hypothetical protein KGN39_00245, partial [Betaproteobacteria bacterium]|nr:hypothetical protein [Betaproteobacteria bacterium]
MPIPSPFDLLIVHAGIWLAFLGYAYGVFQQAAVRPPTPPVHPAGEGVRAGFLSCLGLCGFIFLLSVAASQLLQVVEPILPEWLVLPGINFVLMYFTLTMINLMGYVLRQYRHEPGGSVVVPVNDKRKEDSPEDEVGEVIASLVAEGKLEQALEIASAHRCQDAENDQAQERYIKLLLLANKRERFLNQGRQMISRRLRRGRGDSALDAYLRCLAEDPQFAPEQGKEVL